ncbi:MAG: hypothetical protein QW385_09125 [Thermoproteota archaeon]
MKEKNSGTSIAVSSMKTLRSRLNTTVRRQTNTLRLLRIPGF